MTALYYNNNNNNNNISVIYYVFNFQCYLFIIIYYDVIPVIYYNIIYPMHYKKKFSPY